MPVDMNDVRAALERDEPDYRQAQQLGSEALPHLAALVRGDDPMLAAKAVYLASLLGHEAVKVVADAASHPDPTVRVAAAAATRHLPAPAVTDIVIGLTADADSGVARVALKSVPEHPSVELRGQLQDLQRTSKNPDVRELATRILTDSDA
ncbi:HEAT repeat domain-containing protein [Paractinoplanes toevensis]|uniref:HEAT repeat domain-containing protein n=1 Tax=Paractinoplanes toevensis TaxID=571911 RepID=A0A919WCV0_9ACTN|nr:HEAT repeat domain-containing protein [Actinoplanes toevensis]GIM97802.1 hypothetical protein Ato02nite_095950 [Actinoplanes toevensis]